MKIYKLLLLIIFVLLIFKPCLATQPVDLYFFYGQDCPVCAQAQTFLGELSREYPNLKVKSFEVFFNQENRNLYFALGQAYDLNLSEIPVPVILIGEKSFTSYNPVVASDIRQTVIKCLSQGCASPIKKLEKIDEQATQTKTSKNLFFWLVFILIILSLIFLFKKRKA